MKHLILDTCIYRVSQEETKILLEVMVLVIVNKNRYLNMYPLPKYTASLSKFKNRNCVYHTLQNS